MKSISMKILGRVAIGLAAVGFGAAVWLGAAAARAQNGCSQETLPVRGTPVTVSYCSAGSPQNAPGSELLVPVKAIYSAPGGSFSESATLHFLAGEGPSRVIETVDLSKLGTTGTLHLTLVYQGGLVHVESAILTPGAITIK
jgi:hypothetical protein